MEKLHKLIQTLQASPQKVKLLQEINSQLLSRFRLKITEGIFLYPLEVEAYYNDGDQFEDSSCHCHALQYDRFGKLYFHRLGATDTIDKNRGGTDLCLSTRNGLCYSILIRSAKINDQVIIGPHRVAKKILNQPPTPHSELENKEVLEVSPDNEWTSGPIFHGERIRPGKNAGRYRKLNLRSLTGLKEYKFKDKENVLLSHIHSLEKWEGENPEEQIKEWLGYKSKSLAEALNNLSSRKTVLWKTYNAANPVQTARHADCTLILNGITECLPEFFQDKDRTQRTRLIKDTLARLGNSKGYLFHCNGLETQDAPKESELLYDFMWYTRAPDDRYVITSCPLIAECEWKSKRKKDSPTPYSGIKYDFQKLLLANASLRLMILQKKSTHRLEELYDYFDRAIEQCANLPVRSRFLFIAFDADMHGFHYLEKSKHGDEPDCDDG